MITQNTTSPKVDESNLSALPEDWNCDGCGEKAAMSGVLRPLAHMDCSERDTLEVYGVWEGPKCVKPPAGMFTDGIEIECCGNCGGAIWRGPINQKSLTPE